MLQARDTRYDKIKLIFKEDGHTYTDTLGNSYTSVTTLLGNYKPKFDKDYWLRKKAKELNISTKELEKRWNAIKDEACSRGTDTHNGLEDGIKQSSQFKNAVRYMQNNNGEMITVADLPNINLNIRPLDLKEFIEATNNKYPEIYNLFKFYTDRGFKIYAEIGAFLIDYLLSGTIDVLLLREDRFVIGDWKTNRGGLQFESGYYKKDKSKKPFQTTNVFVSNNERLLPPLNHLPCCNGTVYNMQVSIYAKFVELILGIPCSGMWLCHIDSDFILNEYGMPRLFSDGTYKIKDNPVEKCIIYKMEYKRREVEAILADRKAMLNASKINVTGNLF